MLVFGLFSGEMTIGVVGDTLTDGGREERTAVGCARIVEMSLAHTHNAAHARGGVGVQAVLRLRRAELCQICMRL
jgi:hypothetical protein